MSWWHEFVRRVSGAGRPQVDLKGVVAGQSASGGLGVNLVSLIVTLREDGRLLLRTVPWYLQTVHQ